MSTTLVKSFTHLKDRSNAERALQLLQRVASLVKPIMKKHGWVLPVLSEFYPDNPSLVGLNVNGGQKILLRLRLPHDPGSFYDEEQVVLVMLHELTHNVHGPHDDKFYKLLSELEAEYDTLKRSGYSGEGFLARGRRLGTNVSHNVPMHQARVKALEAAEKRRKVSDIIGRGGRLGGSDIRNLSPRELAARAAERRARDAKACASGAEAEREAAKAAEQSVERQAIDLEGDSDDEVMIIDDAMPVAGPSKAAISEPSTVTNDNTYQDDVIVVDRSQNPRTGSSKAGIPRAASDTSRGEVIQSIRNRTPNQTIDTQSHTRPSASPTQSNPPSDWACQVCTLLNPSSAFQCDACLTPRPTSDSGWTCRVCGEYPMPLDFWTCRFCGTVKGSS